MGECQSFRIQTLVDPLSMGSNPRNQLTSDQNICGEGELHKYLTCTDFSFVIIP